MYIYSFNNFRIICISIILNGHNDPCFEDKSSSLTLKYRPVHFSKNSCTQNCIKDEMTGRVDIYWCIFEANFIWLLSSKISQLETLKHLEVLVSFCKSQEETFELSRY